MHVHVSSRGALVLGELVSCDGFIYECPVRVQTHIHHDHMRDFDRSKGLQDILVSSATRELLLAEFNSDLQIRTNLRAVPMGEPQRIAGGEVTLLPSGHMLGSVQVAVTLASGLRCGYSG